MVVVDCPNDNWICIILNELIFNIKNFALLAYNNINIRVVRNKIQLN